MQHNTPRAGTAHLPYYHVRRLSSGRYAVAHHVPGMESAHVDVDCATLPSAMALAAEMEATHRAHQAAAARAVEGVIARATP